MRAPAVGGGAAAPKLRQEQWRRRHRTNRVPPAAPRRDCTRPRGLVRAAAGQRGAIGGTHPVAVSVPARSTTRDRRAFATVMARAPLCALTSSMPAAMAIRHHGGLALRVTGVAIRSRLDVRSRLASLAGSSDQAVDDRIGRLDPHVPDAHGVVRQLGAGRGKQPLHRARIAGGDVAAVPRRRARAADRRRAPPSRRGPAPRRTRRWLPRDRSARRP